VTPTHTPTGPEVNEGIGDGFTVTAKLEAVPAPQEFEPATVIFPDTAEALKLTVIAFVPLPEAIVAPVGSTHKYVVALVIAGTL
jgi:hypothetical protein